jgi:hypothetical protein
MYMVQIFSEGMSRSQNSEKLLRCSGAKPEENGVGVNTTVGWCFLHRRLYQIIDFSLKLKVPLGSADPDESIWLHPWMFHLS